MSADLLGEIHAKHNQIVDNKNNENERTMDGSMLSKLRHYKCKRCLCLSVPIW